MPDRCQRRLAGRGVVTEPQGPLAGGRPRSTSFRWTVTVNRGSRPRECSARNRRVVRSRALPCLRGVRARAHPVDRPGARAVRAQGRRRLRTPLARGRDRIRPDPWGGRLRGADRTVRSGREPYRLRASRDRSGRGGRARELVRVGRRRTDGCARIERRVRAGRSCFRHALDGRHARSDPSFHAAPDARADTTADTTADTGTHASTHPGPDSAADAAAHPGAHAGPQRAALHRPATVPLTGARAGRGRLQSRSTNACG